jgi:hypothetical protein
MFSKIFPINIKNHIFNPVCYVSDIKESILAARFSASFHNIFDIMAKDNPIPYMENYPVFACFTAGMVRDSFRGTGPSRQYISEYGAAVK